MTYSVRSKCRSVREFPAGWRKLRSPSSMAIRRRRQNIWATAPKSPYFNRCCPYRCAAATAPPAFSLYLREKQSFTKDHLRLLLAASSKLGLSVENALQYERAQDTASTDFLTELPNARWICVHLEQEIARSRRSGVPLAVLLSDLN